MTLRGLPDFHAGVALPDGPAWPGFESRHWLVPAARLRLGEDASGLPAFRLSITRPAVPFMPPPPQAALDLTLVAERDSAAALAALRRLDPRAVVTPIHPVAASARLVPAAEAALPAEIAGGAELICSGLGSARFNLALGVDAAGILAGMLEEGRLPLTAQLVLGFDGVSPRLPAQATSQVSFDPAALLAALVPLLAPEGVTLAALAQLIAAAGDDLPITGEVIAERGTTFAATMADRLAARFGQPAASPAGEAPRLRFDVGQIAAGRFTWDLAQPFPARRWLLLTADPFEAVRAHVAAHGAGALVIRSMSRPIPAGSFLVTAYANLPRHRVGLEALGVTIRADPAPPHRPHAAMATAQIEAPSDQADLQLRLAPGEVLAYAAQGYAIIADAAGVRRLAGPERQCRGPILRLSAQDFAIAPLAIEATADLLAEARIEGNLRYRAEGSDHTLAFALSLEQPSCALGLPAHAEEPMLELTAREREGPVELTLGPFAARSMRFEPASFAGFGPQAVTIRCAPPAGQPLVALELLPQDRPETLQEIEVLAFTESVPERVWRYFARSPFRGGYRWRLRAAPDAVPFAWRQVASAAEPLEVEAGEQLRPFRYRIG